MPRPARRESGPHGRHRVFVGGHLAAAPRRAGHPVVALARNRSKAAALEALGCEIVEGDLSDIGALERLCREATVAFHVAGVVAATYHVAGPEIVTQRQPAPEIGAAVGRRPWIVKLPTLVVRSALHLNGAVASLSGRATVLAPWKAAELLAPAWTCTSDDLCRDTGWAAGTPWAEGLRRTAQAYREQGLL